MADRTANKLTAKQVEALDKPGRYSDGNGLYLAVRPGGSRQWVFLFRDKGRLREMSFGPVNALSLKGARDKAGDVRKQINARIDPIEARRVADANEGGIPTFGEFAEKLVDTIETGFSNPKHRQQWRNTLSTYCKPIWSKPINKVDTDGVLKCLTPIWSTKPETGSRLRGRIERVLNAAKAKGHRSGENPAVWRGHLDATLPRPDKLRRGHHKALPYLEMATFMASLRERDALAALALELNVLTATRTKETLEAEWTEFELDTGLWTIPAARMKTRKEHRVPLSSRALQILRSLSATQSDKYVFPGQRPGRPLSNMAMLMVLRRMGFKGKLTAHGFRSSFSDWASEVSPFSAETRESALAHVVKNKAEAAYRRGDALEKRRAMMEAWAQWCAPIDEQKVVSLRKSS